jgi:hypothetical protein
MEPLCAKLQVSAASSSPRVAMGAFLKRYIQKIFPRACG